MLAIQLLITISLLFSHVHSLIPIEIKSNRFIKPSSDDDDGEVFFIKGVDYQPGGSSGFDDNGDSDVLSDLEACYRDVYALQHLGVNTIRVYTINPNVNHDECMSILNNAGIYVILDLGSSTYSIYRENTLDSYNYNTLARFFKVIDAFKNYPNLLGVFVGNEVINDGASAKSTPRYIRAFQRDVKLYIELQSNRTIPVGYSAADVTELRQATWEYFQCNIDGDVNDKSKSDFFGLNSYEWCSGSNDWETSGYGDVNSTFYESSIPVFYSEYGCNTNSPRTFDEVSQGLYKGLIDSLSGGLVYEYSEESSDYGLVDINDDDSITFLKDFTNLQSQFDKINIPNIKESNVDNHTITKCNSKSIESMYSNFGANFSLPSTPDNVLELIKYGVNNSNIGELINVKAKASNYTINNVNKTAIDNPVVVFDKANEINSIDGTSSASSSSSVGTTSSKKSSSSSTSSSSSSSSTSASSSKSKDAAVALINNYGNIGLISVFTFIISLL